MYLLLQTSKLTELFDITGTLFYLFNLTKKANVYIVAMDKPHINKGKTFMCYLK